MSDDFSNVICESCNSKLSEFSDFREEIIQYQTKLYAYVDENLKHNENVGEKDFIDQGIIEEEEESSISMKVEALEEVITFIPQNRYEEQYVVSNIIQDDEVKPLKFCEACNQYFPQKSFYQHKYRHHAANYQFTCDYDGKVFKQKSEIREHMKTHSFFESRERFLCKFCQNPFLSMSALRNHENYFHSEYIEEHPCDQCEKVYPSRMKLMQHKKTVHTGSTFMCGECNKFYANPASLKKHVDKTHGRKIPCQHCGKLFAQLSIKQHMKTHSEPQFVCTFENCDKRFRILSALNSHLEMHQKTIPVQCPECDATFPTNRHLLRHQKRQHSSFRANCEVANCTHSTTRKDFLVLHYKTHRELDEATRQVLIARVKYIKGIGW